jgi:hypothetical protein
MLYYFFLVRTIRVFDQSTIRGQVLDFGTNIPLENVNIRLTI